MVILQKEHILAIILLTLEKEKIHGQWRELMVDNTVPLSSSLSREQLYDFPQGIHFCFLAQISPEWVKQVCMCTCIKEKLS